MTNLVDSNVFIRSIILSLSDVLQFRHLDSKPMIPEATAQLGEWTGSDYVFASEDVDEEEKEDVYPYNSDSSSNPR